MKNAEWYKKYDTMLYKAILDLSPQQTAADMPPGMQGLGMMGAAMLQSMTGPFVAAGIAATMGYSIRKADPAVAREIAAAAVGIYKSIEPQESGLDDFMANVAEKLKPAIKNAADEAGFGYIAGKAMSDVNPSAVGPWMRSQAKKAAGMTQKNRQVGRQNAIGYVKSKEGKWLHGKGKAFKISDAQSEKYGPKSASKKSAAGWVALAALAAYVL